jgi:2-isopropylmalate synthase
MEHPPWTLEQVQVTAGDKAQPTATLILRDPTGTERVDAAVGTGPVDAIYKCMNRITGLAPDLTEFSVKSVTEGIDAQGEVTIRIEQEGRTFSGKSSDTDILVASARAYIDALNRMLVSNRRVESARSGT